MRTFADKLRRAADRVDANREDAPLTEEAFDNAVDARSAQRAKEEFMRRMRIENIMRDDPELWGEFEFHESTKAFEEHSGMKVVNVVYALHGDDRSELLKDLTKVLECLACSAKAIKLEGWGPGEGKLIVQERLPMSIDQDGSDGRLKVLWYGCITRVLEKEPDYIVRLPQ